MYRITFNRWQGFASRSRFLLRVNILNIALTCLAKFSAAYDYMLCTQKDENLELDKEMRESPGSFYVLESSMVPMNAISLLTACKYFHILPIAYWCYPCQCLHYQYPWEIIQSCRRGLFPMQPSHKPISE